MNLPHFLRWMGNLLQDLATIILSWWIILILAFNTVMDGLVLLHLQEEMYLFRNQQNMVSK